MLPDDEAFSVMRKKTEKTSPHRALMRGGVVRIAGLDRESVQRQSLSPPSLRDDRLCATVSHSAKRVRPVHKMRYCRPHTRGSRPYMHAGHD